MSFFWKKYVISAVASLSITIGILFVYIFYYEDKGSHQIWVDNFFTIDFYSLVLSTLITIFITIFMYLNDKEDTKEQQRQLDLIKDGTRNHINDFPNIFAKSLKMLYMIEKEKHYNNFVYVNFFLNFGAVHAIFKENQEAYHKIALNLGLDKLQTEDNVDLTELESAVGYFNTLLWKILGSHNRTLFILAGDSNLDLRKSTNYHNTTYEISKVIIKILISNNDKRIKNLFDTKKIINSEEEKENYLNHLKKKSLIDDKSVPLIMQIVLYELKKEELTVCLIYNICHLFNIKITKNNTTELRELVLKPIKTEIDKKRIKQLKREFFCIIEAIYSLLRDIKIENRERKLQEQTKALSLYIQYSTKINQLLEGEFNQRKKLRTMIKDKNIDLFSQKNEIYFLKKAHFPHQGLLGDFTKEDEKKRASLIFFISGDTTGSKPKGYYSELNEMHDLHFGAFQDIINNFFIKEEFHV